MLQFLPGWYIMYTRPRNEKKLTILLTEKKIASYLPLVKAVKKWHDRKKVVFEPAFPSYLFVYLSKVSEYFDALNTEGSISYVRTGDKPALVRPEIIEQVSLLIHEENTTVSSEYFEPGKKMLIGDGPLGGYNCEIIKRNGKNKILVRVSLLNRNIIADLPVDSFSGYESQQMGKNVYAPA